MSGRAAGLIFIATLLVAAPANAAIVKNGSFETGDLTGWQKDDSLGGNGYWTAFASDDSLCFSPMSPIAGTYSAGSQQSNIYRAALYQDVRLPDKRRITFSAMIAVASPVDPFDPADSLDQMTQNRQFRIDVLRKGAPLYSVAGHDVLAQVFRTEQGDELAVAQPFKVSVPLSRYRGERVRLRFVALSSTMQCLVARVDDVKIRAR